MLPAPHVILIPSTPPFGKMILQSVISFNGNVTDRREHQRLNAAFQFAKTSLPINIFRDESCRKFLSTLQQLPSLPDYRTVQNDLRSLEKKSLDRLKDATHYGVQLDHWTDFNRNSILVVIVSFITDSFIHVVQVIDFKVVPSQKALEESDPEQVPEISDLDKAFEIQTEAETSLTKKVRRRIQKISRHRKQ